MTPNYTQGRQLFAAIMQYPVWLK